MLVRMMADAATAADHVDIGDIDRRTRKARWRFSWVGARMSIINQTSPGMTLAAPGLA